MNHDTSLLKEISDITCRNRADALASQVLSHNAFYERFAARIKAEWDALPWYAKAWRITKYKVREAKWRSAVAFDVLRYGSDSHYLGD